MELEDFPTEALEFMGSMRVNVPIPFFWAHLGVVFPFLGGGITNSKIDA